MWLSKMLRWSIYYLVLDWSIHSDIHTHNDVNKHFKNSVLHVYPDKPNVLHNISSASVVTCLYFDLFHHD